MTVHTGLTLRGGADGSFAFTVAQPAASPAAWTSRATASPKYAQRFHSRPDLVPPPMTVTTPAHDTAPGLVFLGAKSPDGQNGPMILDTNGQVVWFEPLPLAIASINDFRLQQYRGQPVLTWWEGISTGGHGLGHYRLRDDAYQEVATVQVGNGYPGGDLHEFVLTPRDTALFTVFNPVRWDLSAVGGPKDGTALDGIVEEVEIATGRVLFEWHSLDHVALDEGHLPPPNDANAPFDYIHVNSISLDHDGNVIVSGRHTWGIYKIDHQTGAILWRLGGKRSDFKMGPGTVVAYQHDARILPNGELSVFDNGSVGATPPPHPQSRGVVLNLDVAHKTVTLVREYTHSPGISAASQGNVQVRPSGTVFIGWGGTPTFSEYTTDGALLFDAHFPPGDYSYRAYRFPWTGRPADAPVAVAVATPGAGVTVYASWNGATEVASWQVLAGPDADHLQAVASGPRSGFETAIPVRTTAPSIAVRAVDRGGKVLGQSRVVTVG